jgi:6,7-dimethyl-8-ribityllumazine synthase
VSSKDPARSSGTGGGTVFEGHLDGTGMRIAIAAARFNDLIVTRLLEGARDGLRRHGVIDGDVDIAWVPGAFELPLIASKLAATGRYDAVITLGAVIRGATGHYDLVAGQAAAGVAKAAIDTGVPVVFGILTTETIEQAMERAGTKGGNKGFDAATTAIELVDLYRRLAAAGN